MNADKTNSILIAEDDPVCIMQLNRILGDEYTLLVAI